MTLIYLASPYTDCHEGRERAYELACKAHAHLMGIGLNVFCPIAHTHQAGLLLKDADHQFWMDRDRPFMELAHVLIVVMMDGWAQSRGVKEEMATFKAAGKPILFMEPIL